MGGCTTLRMTISARDISAAKLAVVSRPELRMPHVCACCGEDSTTDREVQLSNAPSFSEVRVVPPLRVPYCDCCLDHVRSREWHLKLVSFASIAFMGILGFGLLYLHIKKILRIPNETFGVIALLGIIFAGIGLYQLLSLFVRQRARLALLKGDGKCRGPIDVAVTKGMNELIHIDLAMYCDSFAKEMLAQNEELLEVTPNHR